MEIKVGEIIKSKREEKGIPLIEFAKKVDVSPGYLSQIENGKKTNPKLELVLKIIHELDIDIKMLLGVDLQDESYNLRIPSLLRLTLAKDRNIKALEEREVVRKLCTIIDKTLENKYIIDDEDLYSLFLEDISIQIDTTLKRYLALPVVFENKINNK